MLFSVTFTEKHIHHKVIDWAKKIIETTEIDVPKSIHALPHSTALMYKNLIPGCQIFPYVMEEGQKVSRRVRISSSSMAKSSAVVKEDSFEYADFSTLVTEMAKNEV